MSYMKEGTLQIPPFCHWMPKKRLLIEFSGLILEVLTYFGCGETFLKWIKLVYIQPTAEILTNSVVSKTLQYFTWC